VLWYFPFENERETMPMDAHTLGRKMAAAAGPTQALLPTAAAGATTQHRGPSQFAPRQGVTQRPAATQAPRAPEGEEEHEEEEQGGRPRQLAPCRSSCAAWPGPLYRAAAAACPDSQRLLSALPPPSPPLQAPPAPGWAPSSRPSGRAASSLAARWTACPSWTPSGPSAARRVRPPAASPGALRAALRTAAATITSQSPLLPLLPRLLRRRAGKDAVPDDVFRRLRGALFFGPGWRVTRNKLMFRDNLQQALAAATPADRHLERRVREWLAECHADLDRIIRFEKMCGAAAQVRAAPAVVLCAAACMLAGGWRLPGSLASCLGASATSRRTPAPARRPPRGASWART
jgi:hypothetical protein